MKKTTLGSLVGLTTLLFAGGSASAGVLLFDFDAPDGTTTGFGHGSALTNNVAANAQVIGNRLRLTQNTNSNSAAFHIPAQPDSTQGFRVWFDYELNSPNGNPADGFAFSYGNIPFGTLSSIPEEGWPGNTPVISWEMDTHAVGSTANVGPTIAVDNVDIPGGFISGDIINGPAIFGEVHIEFRPDGTTDFSSTGAITNAAFNNLATGFALNDNHSFAIAARTGGLNEELFIDNLRIESIPVPEPSGTALLGICLGSLLLRRRRS